MLQPPIQSINDIIDSAIDFDVNRESLSIFGARCDQHPEPNYLIEYVWATSNIHIYRTPDSRPITYLLTPALQPVHEKTSEEDSDEESP